MAARFNPHAYLGLQATVALAFIGGCIWVMAELIDGILDNAAVVAFDLGVSDWIHSHALPGWLTAFSWITDLGQYGVYAVFLVLAILLWRGGQRLLLIFWIAALVGGKLIETILKLSIHRTRPIYSARYLHGNSYSFPSGHTVGATLCYVGLAYILVALKDLHGGRKVAVYAGGVLVALLVGFSRVYLGVHYPSDVLGGFITGGGWLALCIIGLNISRGNPRLQEGGSLHT